jgi:hypothetical protein
MNRFSFFTMIALISLITVAVSPFASSSRPVSAKTSRAVLIPDSPQQPNRVYRQQNATTNIDTLHTLAATYYSLRDNLAATLILSNQGVRAIELRPILFNLEGVPLYVPPVTLTGNTVRAFDLSEWAGAGGVAFQEGSVAVLYSGKEMELGGVVKLVDSKRSLIFDEELTEPAMMFSSARLEGIWWLPTRDSEVSVVVSNTTDSPLTAVVTIDGVSANQTESKTIELTAHQTQVLDLAEWERSRNAPLPNVGGISIQHSGSKGGLLARGLIRDASKGYSNVIEFSDPRNAKSAKLDGAGLRLGKVNDEELSQIVVARNSSDRLATLTGRLSITDETGRVRILPLPKSQLTAGESRAINLNGILNQDIARNAVTAGLEFEYSGSPGSVIMAAQSLSQDENHVFRVPMVDAASISSSTGQYPWGIDESSSTFVYLKNATDKPQQYHLQVNFGDGVYSLGLKTIEPGQPVVFDLRALRDNQVPDVKGRTIPLGATGGQVHWSIDGEEPRGLIGRAEQVDLANGIAMTSACAECCPDSWYSFGIEPGSVSGFIGDTTQFTAMQQNITCYGQILDWFQRFPNNFNSTDPSVASCNTTGFTTAISPGTAHIGASWTVLFWDFDPIGSGGCTRYLETANPDATCDVADVTWTTPHSLNGEDGAVPLSTGTPPQGSLPYVNTTTITATGEPSGGSFLWSTSSNKVTLANTTSSTVTVTAVSESGVTRDVTIDVVYTYNGEPMPPKHVPFTVQKPTFMDFVSLGTGTAPSCPSGESGNRKNITWQVADKNHNPIPYRLPLYDTVTNVTPNSCFNLSAGEGTDPGGGTGTGGRWEHKYRECSTACNNGGSCSVSGTQKYFIQGFEISLGYTMTCTSITVAGH